jgi:SAM-dependent MidA family methyltransferase
LNAVVGLPELSADEQAHSDRVADSLRAAIADAGGWISFAEYMRRVLYAPGLGYYSAGARKFGAAGDFVTAPEVAPVFSRCLAMQCEQVLGRLGGGDVLELGAGSGAMAATLLAELEHRGALPSRYRILDVSADLRERQRRTLEGSVPQLLARVDWLDALPEAFDGVVVANEVLDALPVERFVLRGDEVNAQGVTEHIGRFEWSEVRAGPELLAAVRRLRDGLASPWPEGYASEVNLGLRPWMAALGATLRRGVMLLVDYGLPRREYYSPERSDGTLLCHFRHRFHDDPFARPGLQDITAWVDFTAVAEAAAEAGLAVAGFTTQAHFLIGNGLGEFVADVSGLDLVQRVNLSRQAMLLTLPGEMGERFKVLALARDYDSPLRGFAVRDLLHTL